MKTLSKKIKSNPATAYTYFSNEVEIADAKKEAKNATPAIAAIILSFIEAYEADEPWVMSPKKKAKKKAPKKAEAAIYKPYHDNGGLGVLDYYADCIDLAFDPLVHTSSRYRLPRLKDTAEARCKYLANLWHSAIEIARKEGDQNWFTRIVRHQIAAQTKGNDALKKKSLKGIPMPKDA